MPCQTSLDAVRPGIKITSGPLPVTWTLIREEANGWGAGRAAAGAAFCAGARVAPPPVSAASNAAAKIIFRFIRTGLATAALTLDDAAGGVPGGHAPDR